MDTTVSVSEPQAALPLTGVTVVAFEQAVAAPYCTRLLADLGARVIKVEQPGTGDFTRQFDAAANGLATHFVWLNRNKESVALDCKHAAARPLLDRLLGSADVVVQNLAPGAAHRLGVDAETLAGRYPALVAVDISGYGVGGPLDHRRAYDLLVQSEGGSCAVTGTAGSRPSQGFRSLTWALACRRPPASWRLLLAAASPAGARRSGSACSTQ